jgi:hypothetical protein
VVRRTSKSVDFQVGLEGPTYELCSTMSVNDRRSCDAAHQVSRNSSPSRRVNSNKPAFALRTNGHLAMRLMILLLLMTVVIPSIAAACDVPPQDQPQPIDNKPPQPADHEPLTWPPKPEKDLVQGLWLAATKDDRQSLLWLKDDGSWTTATVIIRTGTADSLEAVATSRDPWHIAMLEDPAASYALVLGEPRLTRCGPGALDAPTFAITRITSAQLVLNVRDESAAARVYERAAPKVAAQIASLVDQANETAKSNLARSTEPLADGVYAVHYEGQGKTVRRTDGAEIILAERLTDRFGQASMFSVVNDNTRFALDLKGAGPLPAKRTAPYFAVVLDGHVLAVAGHTDPHPDATMDFGVQVFGEGAAKAVERRLKIDARRRSHPGHRLLTTWTPTKPRYRTGETATLRLTVKNVGDKPISFRVGGQQRGPRDNQFRFLAYRSGGWGKAIADGGDPTNFGGVSTWRDLKPGEEFTHDVNLSHWFKFTEPDSYRITGLYELELSDVKPDGSHGVTVWEDFAVGECTVYVEAPAPPK